MAPLVAAAALSAAAQWYNSEQARKASQAERKRMEELVNSIQDPNFDPSTLTPEQYQVAAKYVPEMAAFVEEAKPTIVQETADMARGRRAQLDVLERLSGIAESRGIDPQMQALANEASRKAQTEAQVRDASILQDANRRGALTGGATLAAQLNASSDAMDRLASTQNQNAARAYEQRLQALADSGQLGGQIRNQDIDLQSKNANIINQFNERNTKRRQDYLNTNAGLQNEAQRLNIGNLQDINNKNIDTRNAYAKYNQGRGDDIEQSRFNAAMQKANLKSGLSAQNINAMRQDTQDRNAAIQGGTNIFSTYYQGKQAQDAESARQDREDRRLRYQQTGQWE